MKSEPSARNLLQTNIVVYLLLLLITIFSFVMLETDLDGNKLTVGLTEVLVIVLLAFKVSLISDHFMELHYAPKWLRGAMYCWIALVSSILIFIIYGGVSHSYYFP